MNNIQDMWRDLIWGKHLTLEKDVFKIKDDDDKLHSEKPKCLLIPSRGWMASAMVKSFLHLSALCCWEAATHTHNLIMEKMVV